MHKHTYIYAKFKDKGNTHVTTTPFKKKKKAMSDMPSVYAFKITKFSLLTKVNTILAPAVIFSLLLLFFNMVVPMNVF